MKEKRARKDKLWDMKWVSPVLEGILELAFDIFKSESLESLVPRLKRTGKVIQKKLV